MRPSGIESGAENFCADLFVRLGYHVSKGVRLNGLMINLILEKDGLKIPVEIKHYQKTASLAHIREAAIRLLAVQQASKMLNPVLVVLGSVSPAAKHFVEGQYDMRLWDTEVLREKSRPFPDLSRRLAELTVDNNSETVKLTSAPDDAHDLIVKLNRHAREGGLSPTEYEALCKTVMTYLFDPDLYGFKDQERTTDGANRFDFICRIKHGHPFWDTLRRDFRTRSILFECKNYEDEITADQIYSTERYLFSSALRTICFLLSRRGPDDGCKRAAQGALRESGKLILLFSNSDMIDMIRLKPNLNSEQGWRSGK